MRTRWAFASAVVIATIAVAGMTAVPAVAGPAACDSRTNDTVKKLLECVTVGACASTRALQVIADAETAATASPDFRVTPRRRTSSTSSRRQAIGRRVQAFEYLASRRWTIRWNRRPRPRGLPGRRDYQVMDQSDPGDVTASVTPVDVVLAIRADVTRLRGGVRHRPGHRGHRPRPGGPDDFAGFPAGNIALIQRGTCTFERKAANAAAAGAVGVVVFNRATRPSARPDRGTLGATQPRAASRSSATTFARGEEWAETAGLRMLIVVELPSRDRNDVQRDRRDARGDPTTTSSWSVLTSTPSGRAGHQRQRLAAAPRSSRWPSRWRRSKPDEQGALRLVGRRGVRPGRLDRTTSTGSPTRTSATRSRSTSTSTWSARRTTSGSSTTATTRAFRRRCRADRVGRDRGAVRRLLRRPGPGRRADRRSTAAPTTGRSSPTASRPAGCSPAPRASRRREEAAIYGGIAGAPYDPCYHQACDTFANINQRSSTSTPTPSRSAR